MAVDRPGHNRVRILSPRLRLCRLTALMAALNARYALTVPATFMGTRIVGAHQIGNPAVEGLDHQRLANRQLAIIVAQQTSLLSCLQFPAEPLCPAIHVAKAVGRADNGVSRPFEDGAI